MRGAGGEPGILANDFLEIAKKADCETKGVYHGFGFTYFEGIQIIYSPEQTPTQAISAITQVFEQAGLDFSLREDSSKPAGSIYLYVGEKP